jgi:hypothetical protein
MRSLVFVALSSAAGLAATSAGAAPHELQIKDAAARVVVIPEARADVAVSVQPGRGLPAPKVRVEGDRVVVDGGAIGGRHIFGIHIDSINCHGGGRNRQVNVPGHGWTPVESLPLITARVPLDARVAAGQAVFGEIGPSNSLKLAASGCGDWKVADVKGALELSDAGSGDIQAGVAGYAHVNVAGSGDVRLAQVGGLETAISGSGDVHASTVNGPIKAAINGSGDVTVDGGQAPKVTVSIAGSGNVKFGGVAGDVAVSVAGSGDVTIAKATGQVSKRVAGSGDVSVGR